MQRPLHEVLAGFDADAPLPVALTIPGAWYTDPRVHDLESRAVFGRSWQLVARADQVERAGQYVTADVGGEPIVVVRGADGVLRAFFNVCRHHAAAVVSGLEGCAERLTCPYHGWTYGLDGRLARTPEWDGVEGFDRAANGLVPAHVDAWEKLVFVHLDRDPPPLAREIADVASALAPFAVGSLHFVERREYLLACNWKVFVDNYLDGGYHVPYLHKELNRVLEFKEYTIETFARACVQASPIAADPAIAAPARATGAPAIAATRKGAACYAWLYPNVMLNAYVGYLDTNLVVPLAVDRTKVVFDFYFADASESMRAQNAASVEIGHRIQMEDHDICESVQRGLGSRAYGAGRLSVRREAGERLFHQLLASDLRSSGPPVERIGPAGAARVKLAP